ncbi:hypothetical protein [Robiginitalea sp. SC105]|uniref:DUF6913 domain-containing protein n=1 Tax=Robiginitalea sp. SC105 TaxID=2762332 RepID=UPI00351CA760
MKYLRQELSRSRPAPKRKSGVNAIAVIVDLDQFDKAEVFFELIDAFGLRPNAIKVIGYRRYYDKNSPYATPVFSDKDLGWNGEIENSYALEFLSREYDILINYFKEENLLMQLMSVRTQARMRIGFAELDPAYNDLIFDCDLADFGLFRKETKKYLEVLNELV